MKQDASFVPSRRQLLIGGAMLATAGVAYVRTPRQRQAAIGADELHKVIPQKIGGWSYEGAAGLVLPPPDALAAQLYDQQLARVYGSATDTPVMLLIAYGSSQSGMLQVHRPEICYPASGYTLANGRDTAFDAPGQRAVAARQFTASRGPRLERLLYWVRVGDAFTRDWTEQRLAVMRANLSGIVPDGVLVRLSTIGLDDQRADEVLSSFTTQLADAVGARGRRLLFGGFGG